MWTSPTRCREAWPRARGPCWSWTPPRASRRRRWPMCTRRSTPTMIVPVLNKIDLPAAEPDRVKQQIEDVIGLPADDAVMISAKTGLNIEGVLEALVTRLPPPRGDATAPLKALLVDSWYDAYLGVVILVRVKDGRLKRGQKIRMMAQGSVHTIEQVGVFSPR